MTEQVIAMPEDIKAMLAEKIRKEKEIISLDTELWEIGQIATFLGLTKGTVSSSIVSDDTFPEPIILPTNGKRWIAKEVRGWALKRR